MRQLKEPRKNATCNPKNCRSWVLRNSRKFCKQEKEEQKITNRAKIKIPYNESEKSPALHFLRFSERTEKGQILRLRKQKIAHLQLRTWVSPQNLKLKISNFAAARVSVTSMIRKQCLKRMQYLEVKNQKPEICGRIECLTDYCTDE